MNMAFRIVHYLKRLANVLVELLFLSIACFILCAVLLYVGDMFWFLYLETPMGQKFAASFHGRAGSISELFSYNVLWLSFDLTVSALMICIAVSCCSRLLHISRHLYLSIGFFSKIFFWGLPLTALVTLHIGDAYGFEDYSITSLFAAVPTFCLFMKCFKYSDQLLPEFEDVARSAVIFGRHAGTWSVAKISSFDIASVKKIETYLKRN